jgi:hypothetical protein
MSEILVRMAYITAAAVSMVYYQTTDLAVVLLLLGVFCHLPLREEHR